VHGRKLLRYVGSKLVPLQNTTMQELADVTRQLANLPPATSVELYDLFDHADARKHPRYGQVRILLLYMLCMLRVHCMHVHCALLSVVYTLLCVDMRAICSDSSC
jgi:hypothetical protein